MHCSQFSIVRAVKISRNVVMAVKKKGTRAHKECAQVKNPCFTESVNPREKNASVSFRPDSFFSLWREHGISHSSDDFSLVIPVGGLQYQGATTAMTAIQLWSLSAGVFHFCTFCSLSRPTSDVKWRCYAVVWTAIAWQQIFRIFSKLSWNSFVPG